MANAPIFDLGGRVALVTGASSGIGEHFAKLLSASGAKVVIGARRVDRLEALQAEIVAAGGEALAVELDVTDEASTIAAYDAAEAAFGTVDTIIANAGIEAEQFVTDMPVEDFDRVMATNLRGVFLTAREGAKRLVAAGSSEREHGRIVITGSITADTIFPGTSIYSASKAGVQHMARMFAREWARRGICVNVIQPGYIHTAISAGMVESDYGKKLIGAFPRRRLCELSDLDVPLLFFASDASRRVTGSHISIDDGQSLRS